MNLVIHDITKNKYVLRNENITLSKLRNSEKL